MRISLALCLMLLFSFVFHGCSQENYAEGEFYSITEPNGTHTVVRVMKADAGILYLQLYSGISPTRFRPSPYALPTPISVHEKDFKTWNPQAIQKDEFSKSALEQYQSSLPSEVQ